MSAPSGFLMNNYARLPHRPRSGRGSFLVMEDGSEYLDLLSGVAVNALGHAAPEIEKALIDAAKEPIHFSNIFHNEQASQLAKRLALRARAGCGAAATEDVQVVFQNSGAEAIDAAMKLARKATGRGEWVAFSGAFHGRTFGALSLTPSRNTPMHSGFGPLVPGCKVLDWGAEDQLEQIGQNTAAVFVEVVQGEGGANAARRQWLREVAARCAAVGALFVVDEIQAGVGRTGRFFAFEHFGIAPDIITMAKGLGGGVPIGAVLARRSLATAFGPGAHGSTFSGNPLVCRVANAVLDVVEQEGFLESVEERGQQLHGILSRAMAQFPALAVEVRGLGLLAGLRLKNPEIAKAVFHSLLDQRVIANVTAGSVLRILPQLRVSATELQMFEDALQLAMQQAQKNAISSQKE